MKELSTEEKEVMLERKMEPPFSGLYYIHESPGTYACKQCGEELFYSEDKFFCTSGWASFDGSKEGAIITETTDKLSGKAVLCKNCKGFLGTLILNENFTPQNKRFNINSLSIKFKPE